MKKIYTIFTSIFISTICFSGYGWGNTSSMSYKIGVVDYLSVFQNVPQGKITLDKLKNSLEPKINKLKEESDSLSLKMKNLKKNAFTLSKKEHELQVLSINNEKKKFQKKVIQLRENEIKKERSAAKNFEISMQKAINQIVKSEKYTIILNKQAVPYFSHNLDITNQVIDIMKKI